jgi:hypothetical protein
MPVINWHNPVTVQGRDLRRGMVVSYGITTRVVLGVNVAERTRRTNPKFTVQEIVLDRNGKYDSGLTMQFPA